MEFTKDKLAKAKSTLTVVKAKDLPHGQFQAVLSTDNLDRHGEVVSIKGIDVPKDQVIKMYYNHETNGSSLPIGKWNKIWKSNDGKLLGQGEVDLEDDFAIKVYKKIQKGYIDSISIGFYPTEFDGDTSTWTKSTLVEASVVAEPANVQARITSKDLGFTAEEFKKSLKVKLKTVEETDSPFIGEDGTPDEEVVKDPATYGLTAPKKKLDTAVRNKFADALLKGGVADVLNQEDKWQQMEDFWDVIYAFSDAYYNEDAKVTDFNTLLSECITILQTIIDGNYQYEDEQDKSAASGAGEMTEVKSAIEDLKSSVGALEDAAKASSESPAIKTLIKLRLAGKQVDKTAEHVNRIVRIKLKESK